MINLTESLLKQIAVKNSGIERWSRSADFYEVMARATLSFLKNISEEVALQPGVAGRPLIAVIDHIRAWDGWETSAGLIPIARGDKKPPIMESRNFVDRQGRVYHYDHLPPSQAIDQFNQDRAEELRLFMQYRGLTWSGVVGELEQTIEKLVVAAKNIPAEVADQTEPHLWRVLGEPVPTAVYLVAVSTFHVARGGEHQEDFNMIES